MSEEVRLTIRPIYERLIGYMAQAPVLEHASTTTQDSSLWRQLNTAIDELNTLSGKDYSQFKVKNIGNGVRSNHPGALVHQYIYLSEYRSNLNGLIMQLHGEYFANEATPFGAQPGLIMNQTQNQAQNIQISIALELQDFIDKKLYGSKNLDEKDRTFLQKVKEALPTIQSVTQLIATIIRTAKDVGVSVDKIGNLFNI